MGDPGRLSPEDSDRFKEVKLRLVWRSGEGCMAKRLNTDRRLVRKKTFKIVFERQHPHGQIKQNDYNGIYNIALEYIYTFSIFKRKSHTFLVFSPSWASWFSLSFCFDNYSF